MGYAAWHSSFIPPGSLVRSPLTVPGRHKGLRPCGGMYPLTRVGFLETSSPVVECGFIQHAGEGGGVGKGKKDTGYLYKALMVARVLFPVLTCGATRSCPQHRATIKALLTSTQPLSPLRIIRPPVSLPG